MITQVENIEIHCQILKVFNEGVTVTTDKSSNST